MKNSKILIVALAIAVGLPILGFARDIDPFVSTAWLEKNLSNGKLVVIDTRKVEEYRDGHIPGSISVTQASWIASRDGLKNELPQNDDLGDLISDAGIKDDSLVVLVGPSFAGFTWITRVAWTLLYAGVENVAILDGAYEQWTKEGKAVTTDVPKVRSSSFKVKAKKEYYSSKDYLIGKIGKGPILDARAPEIYFGVKKQGMVSQFGHVPGAQSLPTVWIVGDDNLVLPKADLEAMAVNFSKDKNAEVITYCDTGVLATGWWYVLHEVLGYKDVKSFDGSAEEISKDSRVKFEKYLWN